MKIEYFTSLLSTSLAAPVSIRTLRASVLLFLASATTFGCTKDDEAESDTVVDDIGDGDGDDGSSSDSSSSSNDSSTDADSSTDDSTTDDSSTDDSTTDDSSTDDSSTDDASTSEDSSTDDSSTTDDGLDFIPDDDFGNGSECNPFLQDCAQGEKCVPYASDGLTWDANKCVPVLGDGEPGDPCTWAGIVEATDDCGPDSICWNFDYIDGEQVGECTPFCGGTPNDPECAPGTLCLISNNDSITVCVESCDPLAQNCPVGEGCFWQSGSFSCVYTTQDIGTGQPCGFINDCAPGHMCANGDVLPSCNGNYCCAAFCDLIDPVCSQPGTQCVAFFEEGMELPGYENVGICVD